MAVTREEIIEALKEMSLLEASELVKDIEETFGAVSYTHLDVYKRQERVWPLIDEGIQCYHGDMEFQDMLVAVVDFSAGSLSSRVKGELAARMKFDAANGRGALKRRAAQILENVS